MNVWVVRRDGQVVRIARKLIGLLQALFALRDGLGDFDLELDVVVNVQVRRYLIEGVRVIDGQKGPFDVGQKVPDVVEAGLPLAKGGSGLHLA